MTALLVSLWTAVLVGGAVVALLVVGMLLAVRNTARRIDAGGKAIWTVGKRVAQNTAQILLLAQTNAAAQAVASESQAILLAVRRIAGHAKACPGCPDCLVASRGEAGAR